MVFLYQERTLGSLIHVSPKTKSHRTKGVNLMTKVGELKAVIEALPEREFGQLRRWFTEKDWEKWDRQIETDSESGKLDFLVREAHDEKLRGNLKDL